MNKFIKYFLLGITAYFSLSIYNSFKDGDIPKLDENPFWGPKSKENEKPDEKIHPFKIQIKPEIIQDLKTRLKRELEDSRITAPLEGIAFQYGFNTNYLKTLGQYWLKEYDWAKREAELNKWPNFKTRISGLDIHFQHVKSANNGKYKSTKPLLLLHGWPGSFIEFQKVIPLLLEPKNSDVNFELIIPSIPGYGFSEGASKPGLGPIAVSQIFKKLMLRLGHNKFYAQGGDWGAIIVSHMSTLYPENVMATHMNLCVSLHPRSSLWTFLANLFPGYFMNDFERKNIPPFSDLFQHIMRETGYLHLQATKPDTIGVGLSNSPLGLLAYIGEKFSTWTYKNWVAKPDGGLSFFNKDELLDNIMVYWVTNSITTSVRLYSEHFSSRERSLGMDKVPANIPIGCLKAPEELAQMVNKAINVKYPNMVHITEAEKGGHFLAFELPQYFADDIIAFFKKIN